MNKTKKKKLIGCLICLDCPNADIACQGVARSVIWEVVKDINNNHKLGHDTEKKLFKSLLSIEIYTFLLLC